MGVSIDISFDEVTRIWSARSRDIKALRCEAPSQIELGHKLEKMIPELTGLAPKPICTPTESDMRLLKSALCVLQSPHSFQLKIDAAVERFGSRLLHEKQNVFREAQTAIEMANQLGATHVKLCESDPPDFELKFSNGGLMLVEQVEADHPKRKRHAEYKYLWDVLEKFGIGYTSSDPDGWGDAEAIASDVARGVEKKCSKKYGRNVSLAVYVNRSPWDIEDHTLYASIQRATAPAANRFQSVWVKVGARYFRFWNEGAAEPLTVFPSPDRSEDERLFDEITGGRRGQAFANVFGK
jgi:hypothetical protein